MTLPSFRGISATPDPFAPVATAVIPFCQPGDLLIAVERFNSQALAVGVSPIAPAGWTLVAYVDGTPAREATTTATAVFCKQASDTDAGTTVDFSLDNPAIPDNPVVVIAAYANAFGVEQSAVNASFGSGSGTTDQRASTVTTVRANQLILEVFGWTQGTGAASDATPPATERMFWSDSAGSDTRGLVLSEQPMTTPGTTTSRSVTTSAAAAGSAITISIYPNDPPNAPILSSPPDTSTVNVDVTQRFAWSFNDDDPGDTSSGFTLRYSDDDGATWTTVTRTTPNSFWDAAAGTFGDATDYQWQVRTRDRLGALGPFSASFHFTGASVPDVPTIITPTVDEIVGTPTVDVEWSFGAQEGYQVQLWPDDSGDPDTSGDPLFDSGQTLDIYARTLTVPLDTTGVTRHLLVSVKADGLWSDFADVRFAVNFDGPSTPTVTLTTNTSPPTITVYITNPDPTGDELPTVYNDVLVSDDGGETWERKATMLPPNAQWTYWTPASGVDYQFRAVAYTDAGTFAYSSPVDAVVMSQGNATLAPAVVIPQGTATYFPPLLVGGSA